MTGIFIFVCLLASLGSFAYASFLVHPIFGWYMMSLIFLFLAGVYAYAKILKKNEEIETAVGVNRPTPSGVIPPKFRN